MAAAEDQSLRYCREALRQDSGLARAVGGVLGAQRLPGLTNRVFRVAASNGDFVLRLPRTETAGTIDRVGEWHDLRVAADLGITVPPLYGNTATGVLLLPWVERQGELSEALIGHCLARLHCSTVPFAGNRELLPYLRDCETVIAGVPDFLRLSGPLCQAVGRLLDDVEIRPSVPCHFDVSPGNLLPQGNGVLLIDFEYAAMSQAGWDLAYASLENGFDRYQEQIMLRAYADAGGHVPSQHDLCIYKATCDTVSALWALGQEVKGSDAEDLVQFARLRIARAMTMLNQRPDTLGG